MKNVLIVWRIQFWNNISRQLSVVRECFVALGFQKCRLLFSTVFCVGRTCGPFRPYWLRVSIVWPAAFVDRCDRSFWGYSFSLAISWIIIIVCRVFTRLEPWVGRESRPRQTQQRAVPSSVGARWLPLGGIFLRRLVVGPIRRQGEMDQRNQRNRHALVSSWRQRKTRQRNQKNRCVLFLACGVLLSRRSPAKIPTMAKKSYPWS